MESKEVRTKRSRLKDSPRSAVGNPEGLVECWESILGILFSDSVSQITQLRLLMSLNFNFKFAFRRVKTLKLSNVRKKRHGNSYISILYYHIFN